MSTLILVTGDSGAGHLKQERRADQVLTFSHRLVTGPVPARGAPEDFFRRRRATCEAEGLCSGSWRFGAEDPGDEASPWRGVWRPLPDMCRVHDRVELWIDPDPNAQLVLVQLLDWLGHRPEIAPRLWLKQAEAALGERRPGDWVFPPRPVDAADVALASRAWAAFGASTPAAWAAMRNDPELHRLAGLRRAVEQSLDELPDHTGLGATARRILGLIERQGWWTEADGRGEGFSGRHLSDPERCVSPLMQRILRWGERCPLSYFEIGETLCELAAAPVPALTGVTEHHFDQDMHHDTERHRRFRESPISLTELGHRLVAGRDDWSLHNPVHRYLGGTRLTNDMLWRWDASQERLLEPQFLP